MALGDPNPNPPPPSSAADEKGAVEDRQSDFKSQPNTANRVNESEYELVGP